MNVFELTRRLVDVESITPNETAVGDVIFDVLSTLATETQGRVERMPVEPRRDNILLWWDEPIAVTLSTHMDTVPPFYPSSEDDEWVYGRGSCDAKGIMAAMIVAAEELVRSGVRNHCCLFVVGEERNSAGALHASKHGRGSRFLINGEPTENILASGTKGTLRFEVEATGRAAHSAYPQLGDSAVEKLLDVLQDLRRMPLPKDDVLGPSTLNIGTLGGGVAPNVVADYARADVHFRLVDDGSSIRAAVHRAAAGRATAREVIHIPPVFLKTLPGYAAAPMAYTTDIPAFGGAWGTPLLFGPGTIHVAHTDSECIAKRELTDSVRIYQDLVRQLLAEPT